MYQVNGLYTVTVDGVQQFLAANPAGGRANGTEITDSFLNDVELELLNVVEGAGITPAPNTPTQVLAAIMALKMPVFPAGSNTNSLTSVSTSYSFTAPRALTLSLVGVAGSSANAITSSNLPSLSFSAGTEGVASIIGLGALSIILAQVSLVAGEACTITLTQNQPTPGSAIAVGFNSIGILTS